MYPKGGFIKDGENNYWLVLEESEMHHTEGCATGLFNGKIVHMSNLPQPLTGVYGSEIMW